METNNFIAAKVEIFNLASHQFQNFGFRKKNLKKQIPFDHLQFFIFLTMNFNRIKYDKTTNPLQKENCSGQGNFMRFRLN